jgi:hypothetical protein
VSLQSNVDIYNRILAGLSKGVKLVAILDGRGDPAAKDVRKRNEELAAAAADVRRAISKTWSIDAKATLTKLRGLNDQLQGQVEQIQNAIEVATKVVKALGYVDEIVKIAGKIAATA